MSIQVNSMLNTRIEQYILGKGRRIIAIPPKSNVTLDKEAEELFKADAGAMNALKLNHMVTFSNVKIVEVVETPIVKTEPKQSEMTNKEINKLVKACNTLDELEPFIEMSKKLGRKGIIKNVVEAKKRFEK